MLDFQGQDPLSIVGGRRCYKPMERTLENRRTERGKTKGRVEMRQVSRLLCLFNYIRVSEKERARGRPATLSGR